MKVLILSCNTGAGHNSAALAIKEMMVKLGHDCVLKDALSYASQFVSDRVSNSYNSIVMHTPKAFGVGYRYCKSKTYTPGKVKSASYALNMVYSKRLYEDILRGGYDAVLCTHVFAAQSMTHVKHKHKLDIPLYVIATDYAFCPYYDELDVNNYFISLEKVKKEFLARGIEEDKIIPTGIPVSDRFNVELSRNDARIKLGIYHDRFLCTIMSGSMGYGNIFGLIDKVLESNAENYEILVICGNNKKLREGISKRYANVQNVCAIGFTTDVHLFMKASDLIVTKPGGLSSTEAMVSNTPLILTSPIPGCETENYEILTSLGVAAGGDSVEEAVEAFISILNGTGAGERIREKQRKYINPNSARDICGHVLKGLGVEVS